MKKLLVTALLIACSSICFGQNTIYKSIELNNAYRDNLRIIYDCDDNNENCDIYISIGGQNHKYQHIADAIIVYFGTPADVHSFLQEVENFYYKNLNVSNIYTKIHGHSVSKTEIKLGRRKPSPYITIFEDSASSGYRTYMVETITELKEKLEEWAKENDIDLSSTSAKSTLNNTNNTTNNSSSKSIVEQLKEAKDLFDTGVITEEEFSQIKKKLLE